MYKISRSSLVGALIAAQDNGDVNNYIWICDLYSTRFKSKYMREYSLETLDKNQIDILIEYLIKSNSYGDDTDLVKKMKLKKD